MITFDNKEFIWVVFNDIKMEIYFFLFFFFCIFFLINFYHFLHFFSRWLSNFFSTKLARLSQFSRSSTLAIISRTINCYRLVFIRNLELLSKDNRESYGWRKKINSSRVPFEHVSINQWTARHGESAPVNWKGQQDSQHTNCATRRISDERAFHW